MSNERMMNNAKATMGLCIMAMAMDQSEENVNKSGTVLMDIMMELMIPMGFSLSEEEMEKFGNELENIEEVLDRDELERIINEMSDSEKKVMIYNAYRVLNADSVITADEKEFLDRALAEWNFTMEEVLEEGENKGFDMESIFAGMDLDELNNELDELNKELDDLNK